MDVHCVSQAALTHRCPSHPSQSQERSSRLSLLIPSGGQYEERWPEEERNAILFTAEFSYDQRLEVGTFLFGNLRDSDLVFAAVRPQLGADPTHLDHFRRFLADLASGKYDEKYHYFDVLKADWFFVGGALNARRSPPSPFARLVHAWDAECMRMRRAEGRWPTLGEQRTFVGM